MSLFNITKSWLRSGVTLFKSALCAGFLWLGFTFKIAQKLKYRKLAVKNSLRGHAALRLYIGVTPNALPPNTRQTFEKRPCPSLFIFQIYAVFLMMEQFLKDSITTLPITMRCLND